MVEAVRIIQRIPGLNFDDVNRLRDWRYRHIVKLLEDDQAAEDTPTPEEPQPADGG